MVKIVVCRCDYCGRSFHEWVYKRGDNMDGLDYCPEHSSRCV